MKKILIAAICSLFACGALFAQSASVEEFCKKLSVHENMVGNFVQEKTIAKTNRSLKSTGRFIFCPEGFVWETQKPFKVSMIVTKKSLIQIGADGKKKIMDGSSNPTFTSISDPWAYNVETPPPWSIITILPYEYEYVALVTIPSFAAIA